MRYLPKLILLTTIFISTLLSAQNNTHIAGEYRLDRYVALVIFEDGRYAIAHFGGLVAGNWTALSANKYGFKSNEHDVPFQLWARHNKEIAGKTRLFFNNFEIRNTFIQLKQNEKQTYKMQRVFNESANCFSFPYVHQFKQSANYLSFTHNYNIKQNSQIITFNNPNGYNDFVANFKEVKIDFGSFTATIKDKVLTMEDGTVAEQSPLNNETKQLSILINQLTAEKNTIYFNAAYNEFVGIKNIYDVVEKGFDVENLLEKHYQFDAEKNAYILNKNSKEQRLKSNNPFHDMSKIYDFKAIKDYTANTSKFKLKDKSIFNTKCN